MVDWIGTREASVLIGVAEITIWRSLRDEAERTLRWGAEGVGWRLRPGVRRTIFQVNRVRVEEIAAGVALADSKIPGLAG